MYLKNRITFFFISLFRFVFYFFPSIFFISVYFVGFVSFRFVSFRFRWFRFVSFRFRWFRFVSFRFYFVWHFIGTRYRLRTCSIVPSGWKKYMPWVIIADHRHWTLYLLFLNRPCPYINIISIKSMVNKNGSGYKTELFLFYLLIIFSYHRLNWINIDI